MFRSVLVASLGSLATGRQVLSVLLFLAAVFLLATAAVLARRERRQHLAVRRPAALALGPGTSALQAGPAAAVDPGRGSEDADGSQEAIEDGASVSAVHRAENGHSARPEHRHDADTETVPGEIVDLGDATATRVVVTAEISDDEVADTEVSDGDESPISQGSVTDAEVVDAEIVEADESATSEVADTWMADSEIVDAEIVEDEEAVPAPVTDREATNLEVEATHQEDVANDPEDVDAHGVADDLEDVEAREGVLPGVGSTFPEGTENAEPPAWVQEWVPEAPSVETLAPGASPSPRRSWRELTEDRRQRRLKARAKRMGLGGEVAPEAEGQDRTSPSAVPAHQVVDHLAYDLPEPLPTRG
jgi:hypothetical protein